MTDSSDKQGDWRKEKPKRPEYLLTDFTRDLRRGFPFWFSGGEYSDYGVIGLFLPLVDISAESLLAMITAFNAELKIEEEREGWLDGDSRERFIALLIKQGILMELVAPEINIGPSYSSMLSLYYEKDKTP